MGSSIEAYGMGGSDDHRGEGLPRDPGSGTGWGSGVPEQPQRQTGWPAKQAIAPPSSQAGGQMRVVNGETPLGPSFVVSEGQGSEPEIAPGTQIISRRGGMKDPQVATARSRAKKGIASVVSGANDFVDRGVERFDARLTNYFTRGLKDPNQTGSELESIGSQYGDPTLLVVDSLFALPRNGRIAADREFAEQYTGEAGVAVPPVDVEQCQYDAARRAAEGILEVLPWQIVHSPLGGLLPREAAGRAKAAFDDGFSEAEGVTIKHPQDQPNIQRAAVRKAYEELADRAARKGVSDIIDSSVTPVQAVQLVVDNLNRTPTAEEHGIVLDVIQLAINGTLEPDTRCFVDAEKAAIVLQGETDAVEGRVTRADYGVDMRRPEENNQTAFHHAAGRLADEGDRNRELLFGCSLGSLPSPIKPLGTPSSADYPHGLLEIAAVAINRDASSSRIIRALGAGIEVVTTRVDDAGTTESRMVSQRQDLPAALAWLADPNVLGVQGEGFKGPETPGFKAVDSSTPIIDAEIVN